MKLPRKILKQNLSTNRKILHCRICNQLRSAQFEQCESQSVIISQCDMQLLTKQLLIVKISVTKVLVYLKIYKVIGTIEPLSREPKIVQSKTDNIL